jgi:GT2 family glycosyltransferase
MSLTRETRYEIIIVDNASTERDPDEFLHKYPGIKLIRNKSNVGFGIANNQGMAVAQGTYFLLINSDCYLVNNAVDLAFRFAVERPETKVFGATLLNEDGSFQRSHYGIRRINVLSPVQSVLMLNPVGARIIGLRPGKVKRPIGGLYGAYIWLHRSVYETVGGFDPDFFMYCEETEWFRKRIAPKYRIGICKEARICHLGGKSSASSVVNAQKVLSYYLYWYKLGRRYFWIFTIGSLINLVSLLFLLPFMRKGKRRTNILYISTVLGLLPKLFFDIPRYSNHFGSRKSPLKVDS